MGASGAALIGKPMVALNAICLIGLLAIAIAGDQQHDVVPELEAENGILMSKLSDISGAPLNDGHFSDSELQVLRGAQALADSEVKASTAAQAVKRDKQQAIKTSSHDWQLELQADKLRQATATAQVHEANAALEHLQQEHNNDLVHGNIHLSSPMLTAPFDKRLDASKRKHSVPNRGGESLKPAKKLGGESLKPEPFDATKPPGPKSVGGSIKLRMDAVSAELLRRSARYQAEEKNEQKKLVRDQALTAHLRGKLASLVAQVAQTKARLRDTVARAKREARKHAYSLKRFKQLKSKETHHKKMVEVEAGIQRTQEAVKQQTQAFKTSQIQLKKLLERKQDLLAQGHSEEKTRVVTAHEAPRKVPREGADKALPDPLQGMSIPQHTVRQTPVPSSTLSDVQAHVTTQSLEQELAPKIQRLHSLLSGHTLQVAIQRLVTRTVNAKVKSAIQQHAKTQVQSEASILDDLRAVASHGELGAERH